MSHPNDAIGDTPENEGLEAELANVLWSDNIIDTDGQNPR